MLSYNVSLFRVKKELIIIIILFSEENDIKVISWKNTPVYSYGNFINGEIH